MGFPLRRALRYFEKDRVAKVLTTIGFFAAFGVLGSIIYTVARIQLYYIARDEFTRSVFPYYLYEVTLLALGVFVFSAVLLGGAFQLFRSRIAAWTVATPSYSLVPLGAIARTILSTLLPLLVVVVPLVLAIRRVFKADEINALFSGVAVVFTLLLVILLAYAVLLLIAFALKKMRVLTMWSLLVAVLVPVVFVAFSAFDRGSITSMETMFPVTQLESTQYDLSGIGKRFEVFPTHIAADVLLALNRNDSGVIFVNMSLLILLCVLVAGILFLQLRSFLPIWQSLEEGAFIAGKHAPLKRPHGVLTSTPRWFNAPSTALLAKEILLFIRNGRDLFWLGFFALLWLLQIGAFSIAERQAKLQELDATMVPISLQSFELVTVAFFVGAVALRFVFPAVSIERKHAWLLATSPIPLAGLFRAKLFFLVPLLTLLALTMSSIHISVVEAAATPLSGALFLALAVVMSAFITTLALSIGAMFPNFETDDPQLLSTSLPGIGTILFTLLYGLIGGWTFYAFLLTGFVSVPILFIGVSLALIPLIASLGERAVRRIEFSL
jgi:ABC-2 type transport system permease protein